MMEVKGLLFPEKMETYHRDDQVILFNLLNMTYSRLQKSDYQLLVTYFSHSEKRTSSSFLGKKKTIANLLFHLHGTGFFNKSKNPSENEVQSQKDKLSSLYISLTRECNLRCRYCYAHGGEKDHNTMEPFQILSLIDEAKELAIQKITFTGGEPLLCQDLFTFARKGKDMGLSLEIITNGTLINKKNIREMHLFDMVVITLDGSTSKIHDETRGEGSFLKTLEGLHLLLAQGIQVTVNTIINKMNYHDLYNIIKLLGKMGIYQHNTNVHLPMGRGERDGLECSQAEIEEGRFQLGRSLQENMNQEYILRRIKNSFPIPYLTRKGCGAGITELFISHDGLLYPCRLLQFPLFMAGNVKESSLKDLIIHSKALSFCQRFYEVQIEECASCSIYNYCQGGCRAMHYLYSGDPFCNSQHICAMIKEDLELTLWLKTGYLPSYYYKGE